MLQKTNAEKVELVYPGFIKKYPDFKSLKKGSEMKLKEELKYLGLQNQKVPVLKELSNICLKQYNNTLPSKKEDLISIKGIGDYIANAVLCFAFNQRVPIIDGNVIRILKRVFNITSKKKNPRSDIYIWEQMEQLLPKDKFKRFNYALLDFAALICKFYNPKCEICFFVENCYYLKNLVVKDKKSN